MEVPPQFQQIADELQERGGAPADGAAAGRQAVAAAEGSGALSGSMGGAADGVGAGGAQTGVEGGSRGSGDGGSAASAAAGVPRKYTITPHDGPDSAAGSGATAGLPPQQAQQQAQQQPVAAANGTASGPAEPAMTLLVAGQRYHVVNTQLLLLSMLREYATFRDAVPAFAAEVRTLVHDPGRGLCVAAACIGTGGGVLARVGTSFLFSPTVCPAFFTPTADPIVCRWRSACWSC